MQEKHDLPRPNRKLRLARDHQHWSQEEAAAAIGVDRKTYIRWEQGQSFPQPKLLDAACKAFGMSASALGFDSFPEETIADSPNDLVNGLNSSIETRENVRSRTAIHNNEQPEVHPIEINSITPTNRQIRASLAKFLQREQTRMLNALVPGSTNLRVKDILDDNGLFISPPWKMSQGSATSINLTEYLIDALIKDQSVLLLGEAGQGKTTILKQVFSLLAEKFLNTSDSIMPFPLYIPLRDFPSLTGSAIELLWTYIGDEFPLSFNNFADLVKNNQIVFLFDSFDEIKGELTQSALNDRASSRIFARPSILSCRKSFFDFYLSMSPLHEYYSQWVELQPLELTQPVAQYITAFYRYKQNRALLPYTTTPERIINVIRSNQKLQDLVQRPLLLVMILDIFTDPKETKESEWNITKLYRKYTEKWLKNEAAKSDSVLKWNKKNKLLQDVAWLTHVAKSSLSSPYRLRQNETFTQNDLASIVKNVVENYGSISEMQLLDELCFRTLLGIAEGDKYYFLHKSFHEYYIAEHIFERLHDKGFHTNTITLIGQVLQEVLPFEVATFLKEMLESKELTQSDRDLIVNNLIETYQEYKTNEVRSVMIRQQASHYLARLGTSRATQFLERNYELEVDKLVQRGMMVSLALYCGRPDILERYVKIVRSNPEAAAINLGYHLVYYGDQAQEFGYYDQRGERCEGAIRSIFRHLNDETYKNGWSLDILTLSMLIESRGLAVLDSHKQQLSFLKDFLSRDHQEQGSTFQQERETLKEILKGVET